MLLLGQLSEIDVLLVIELDNELQDTLESCHPRLTHLTALDVVPF
jgi:hypothetical protein